MSKKELLAKTLFNPLSPLSWALSKRKQKALHVLAYHRVFAAPDANYPFNEELISVTPEQFDEQMRFVKDNFNVINFLQLADMQEQGKPIEDNTVIITFDDGYADNYELMMPIVQAHGLTAVVYVATHYVEQDELFWVDRLACQVNRMNTPQTLKLQDGQWEMEVTDSNRKAVRQALGRLINSQPEADRLPILQELAEQTNVEISETDHTLARPMTWDEVKGLYDGGMEVGSHTVNHGFLAQMTDEQIYREVSESKQTLEEKIGGPVVSIAYPAGNYDSRVLKAVEQCGYPFGIAYDHRTAPFAESHRYEVPRIHVEIDVSFPLFKANLLMPEVFVR